MLPRKTKFKILAGAVILTPIALALWAFQIEPGLLITRHTRLELPGWRTALRVAVISDLHIGSPHVGLDQLKRIVERTNAEKPQLVVLLGDFVIGGPGHRPGVPGGTFVEPEAIANGLKDLRAPLGVFAVLGNHDWWYDGDRVHRALSEAGIRVLQNQAERIENGGGAFWLGGIGDMWTGHADVEGTLAQTAGDEPVLLITHNPDVFPMVPPRVSLTIAAHTHGGQVSPPIIGPVVTTSRLGYVRGLYGDQGHQLFVTTGIGTSIMAVRFGVPPEIVILTLQPQARETR